LPRVNVEQHYAAAESRYDDMTYRRSGRSGLLLPAISLGLWLNFGDDRPYALSREIVLHAFDRGITHFDLANNYGPPNGSAERHFGRMLSRDLRRYRDELIVSTKAGYDMWPGPYGNYCSRKNLLASLDQSLSRLGLDYVDIFYSHRLDPDTPLDETMGALDTAVTSGKALYVGLSTYPAEATREAVGILRELRTPVVIHQPSYSMVNRWIEDDLLGALEETGLGCIVFSALAQGLLSERYLSGVPSGSRAADRSHIFRERMLSPDNLERIHGLAAIAASRGQSLAQMAIAWVLRQPVVTSALLGASSVEQLDDSLAALENLAFDDEELAAIDQYATEAGVNLWRPPALAGG
jgi:L-glyceraldehyde 3-phosphate reductase